MSVWYLLIVIVGIMILYIVGANMSNTIEDTTLYFLFWLMYFITITTFITVAMSIIFYMTIKEKEGPQGPRGDTGNVGDKGEAGICEEGCRNRICYNKVMEAIGDEVNEVAGLPSPEINVKNIYLKERVKQMCHSKEFKQLTPFRGPNDLISYLIKLWKTWTGLIYTAGGRRYFESLGAENEFEWVKDNPFDEIKKYDVFYWGMGKTYRPEIIKKCEKARQANLQDSENTGKQRGHPSIEKDDKFGRGVNEGKGWHTSGGSKQTKYSVLSYLNLVPESYIKNNVSRNKYYIKTTDDNEPNSYTVRMYDPMTKKYNSCFSIEKDNKYYSVGCNPDDKKQQWELEYTGNKPTEFKLKSKLSKTYFKPPNVKDDGESDYTLFNLSDS